MSDAISDPRLAAELATAETDSPVLRLAKAVARECVHRAGVVKAGPAIERARLLAAGVDPGSARVAAGRMPDARRQGRVLGAAVRR